MRIILCCTVLFVCLAVIPSVQCARKYKLSEFDERDKRDTKERYTKRDDDQPRYRKNKFRSDSDEDFRENKSDKLKKLRRVAADEDTPPRTRRNQKFNDEERGRKTGVSKLQSESEEDYTEETEEDTSEVCVDKKGRRCESDDTTDEDYTEEDYSDDGRKKKVTYVKKFAHEKKQKYDKETDETDEDYTDEDYSDSGRKKKVTYVKKFAHEKKKQKQDKETGNILKIHKRAGLTRRDEDDDTSEETVTPKRRRFTYDDDDE